LIENGINLSQYNGDIQTCFDGEKKYSNDFINFLEKEGIDINMR